MKNCKTKNCIHSTMQEYEDGICDTCWTVVHAVKELHNEIMEMNDQEPLDGDETETLAKLFLSELNKLNGNI